MKEYKVIGIMSGTSLDGLDMCYAKFFHENDEWSFKIIAAQTFEYKAEWADRLRNAAQLKESNLDSLDIMYGQFIGKRITQFVREKEIKDEIDLVCSHGHTIFHQPSRGITRQIGDGQAIANVSGFKVVNNFRQQDVQLNGQGAPLVPVGDRLLFGEYEACLNLGGFANISFEQDEQRIAFDVCPLNLPLNEVARRTINRPYDEDGKRARSGQLIKDFFNQIEDLEYYKKSHPKSLGVEWLNANIYSIGEDFIEEDGENLLHTLVEHETNQLAEVINRFGLKSVLVTGGGVKNLYLMDRLRFKTKAELKTPDLLLVDFKEALIFGFLGVLRFRNEINTYSSVTGATRDSVGGKLYSVVEY